MEGRPEVPEPRVAELADEVLQRACAADPTLATRLGDHRFDGELPDPSAAARDRRIAELEDQRQRALALAENAGGVRDLVDLDVLAGALSEELVLLRDVREPDWNPSTSPAAPWSCCSPGSSHRCRSGWTPWRSGSPGSGTTSLPPATGWA